MPGIPENITIAGRTPATIKGNLPPLIDTAVAARGGFRAGDDTGGGDPAGVIFSENFNDQPEFTATRNSTDTTQAAASGYTIPDNWTAVYQGTSWSPETGFANKKSTIEILSANGGRGGSGKCFLGVRESNEDATGGSFQSDGQLIKAPIDPNNVLGTDELYVEFWIRFDANWWNLDNNVNGDYPGGWQSKIFRAASWTPGGNYISGGGRDMGPMFYWDYKADNFGLRNSMAFRGGPPANLTTEDNYKNVPVDDDFGGGSGFWGSYNSSGIAGQEVGGADPQLPDLVNGGLIADYDGLVTHEMLFGPAEKWTKMAFYLKMNSAPAATDGVFSQYIDGHRVKHSIDVPWVAANTENIMVKWNHFSIGGNDYFAPIAPDQLFEDYYYIDDIVVRDSLPGEFI